MCWQFLTSMMAEICFDFACVAAEEPLSRHFLWFRVQRVCFLLLLLHASSLGSLTVTYLYTTLSVSCDLKCVGLLGLWFILNLERGVYGEAEYLCVFRCVLVIHVLVLVCVYTHSCGDQRSTLDLSLGTISLVF